MLVIILIIVPGLYLLFLLTRKTKRTLDEDKTKKLRLIHYGLLALITLLAFLASANIYLRGYWTTKVIIWLFVLTAITLFAFGHRQILKRAERFYFGLFFYTPLALIPLSFVPFLGIGILLTIYGFTIGDYEDIKYSDSKYRLQQTYRGFLAPASPPDLFVKHGLFEYREKPLPLHYIGDSDSIKIKNLSEHEIEIEFYHNRQFTDRESPIKFLVEIAE